MEIFPRCFKSYKKTEDKTEELAWDPKEVNKQFQGLEGGYLSGQAEIKLGDCILRVMPEWQALSKFSFLMSKSAYAPYDMGRYSIHCM